MGLSETYHYYMEDLADERTKNWFLVSSPVSIILILSAYLYFVLRCGPRYMKDKPPYSFRTFIRCYDVFQMVANAMIVYHIFDAGWYQDFFFYCYKPDYSWNPQAYKFAKIMWYVYMTKYIDCTETVIFVLRKKQRQVSTLHLYHHVSTILFTWLTMKYWAHGVAVTVPCVNSSIHVVMYIFYFISSFGPKAQAFIQPLKPIITLLQMVQFVWLIICALQIFFKPECSEMITGASVTITNLFINFVLFYKFYKENYPPKDKKVK